MSEPVYLLGYPAGYPVSFLRSVPDGLWQRVWHVVMAARTLFLGSVRGDVVCHYVGSVVAPCLWTVGEESRSDVWEGG